MFYDAFADLIAQSGDALETREANHSEDPRFRREGRQIATLLRRTGAVWAELFSTLEAENRILERGLETAHQRISAAGNSLEVAADVASALEAAPLQRYRALNLALDGAIKHLAPLAQEAWAEDALYEIRSALAEAAQTQGRLVDRMLEVR